jgi:hypothetical protein
VDEPRINLVLSSPPVAQPAPLAQAVPDTLAPIEERIRRLEAMLAGLQQMQAKEPRPTEQVTTGLPPEKPAGPSVLERATTLLEAGKHLLPSLAPAAPEAGRPASGRAWLMWELLAEARAILHMYTDPRYRLSWAGGMLPPLLLVALVTAQWWVPFAAVPVLGWVVSKLIELALAFVLFKVLAHEARRYRETAPGLPPSLRL